MATKKKAVQKKEPRPTIGVIIDAMGGLSLAVAALIMAITVYKMVMHLIATNKLT
jgi:hypothetical protein